MNRQQKARYALDHKHAVEGSKARHKWDLFIKELSARTGLPEPIALFNLRVVSLGGNP